MPTLSEGQIRGDAGERWFAAQLPKGWLLQKPTTDVGIDGLVVVCEPGILNGLEFRIQIKTSKSFVKHKDHVVVPNLNIETVRYWFANPTPLLLVAFDEESEVAYFGWHDDIIDTPGQTLKSHRATLTVHLKLADTLSQEGWELIRKRLQEHYAAILRAFYQSEVAGFLVPILHDLATHVKYLVFAHCAQIWDDNKSKEEREKGEKLLWILEVRTHQEVIVTLNKLIDKLREFPIPKARMVDFLARYKADVSTFIIGFGDIPMELDPDYEIVVAPERMRIVRPVIIDALLDTMRLLSQPAKADDSPEHMAPDSIRMGDETLEAVIGSANNDRRKVGGLPYRVTIVRLAVRDLGYPEGATTKEIIGMEYDTDEHGHPAPFSEGRGVQLGLELCSAEVAPYHRLEYKDQPLGERLYVAMKPINTSDGEPRIFVLEHSADGLSLDAVRARPDDKWEATDIFIFCMPA